MLDLPSVECDMNTKTYRLGSRSFVREGYFGRLPTPNPRVSHLTVRRDRRVAAKLVPP